MFARDDKNGSLAQSLAELEEHVLHLNHLKQHHSVGGSGKAPEGLGGGVVEGG